MRYREYLTTGRLINRYQAKMYTDCIVTYFISYQNLSIVGDLFYKYTYSGTVKCTGWASDTDYILQSLYFV